MEQKPFIIEIEEAKNELVQCLSYIVNDKKIPCYFLVSTMENLLQQVRVGANNELQMAIEQIKKPAEQKVEE